MKQFDLFFFEFQLVVNLYGSDSFYRPLFYRSFWFGFQPDYEHLDWLAQVWGFQWHKRYEYLWQIPF